MGKLTKFKIKNNKNQLNKMLLAFNYVQIYIYNFMWHHKNQEK